MESRPWHRHYDYNVPTSIRYPRICVHDLLTIPTNVFPNRAATIFFGTEMTFSQLRKEVMRMANALGTLGIKKGDRVGMHLPNCPQYLIAYYALLHLGAIVVNINPMYTVDELKLIMEITDARTLITFDTVLPNVRKLCQLVEIPRVVVTRVTDYVESMPRSTPEELGLEEGWHHFSTLLENCSDTRRPRVEVSPEDPAVLQFTGGTTGIPKGAITTHENLVSAAFTFLVWYNAVLPLTPPEKRIMLSVLPYFHSYGNSVVMGISMVSCATQIVVPRFDVDGLMNILAQFDRITFFPTVPTIITALLNHPRTDELNLGDRLGTLISGAAPLPQEHIERANEMGIILAEGYGLSETCSVGCVNPALGLKKVGSIGLPLPGVDVRIVDLEDGEEEVPVGERGELIMKGPSIVQGYWNNPEETANQFRNGWLYTGDIAMRDEDHYFYIVDRKKDMIIAGGFNIYPREVDEVLYQHPKVLQAVAVGIPDAYRGETVKAYVVLKPGETATEDEIISFCREKLAAYKVPKLVEFRNSLPQSAVGKVLRKILRQEEEAKAKNK